MMERELNYASVNLATGLVSTFNALRHKHRLCDVIITSGRARIPAHRLMLAAFSPFFDSLVDSNDMASVNGMPMEFHLGEVDTNSLVQIIEFCYTSFIKINEENVWTLLPAAAYLKIWELCELCSDFLLGIMSADTLMKTMLVAQRSGLKDFITKVQTQLKDSLDKVLESEGFLEMQIGDVTEVLKKLPASVLGHRDTVRAIRSWVMYMPDTRRQFASKLGCTFPGLRSRLKEFLPENLLCQPAELDSHMHSQPASPDLTVASRSSASPSSVRSMPSPSPYGNGASPLDLRTHLSPSEMRARQEAAGCDSEVKDESLSPSGYVMPEGSPNSMIMDSEDSPACTTMCMVCGEIFNTPQELSQHQENSTHVLFKESGMTLQNGFPSSPTGSSGSRDEEGGNSVKGSDRHACNLCCKVFSDRKSLGKHMRTHSQNGFACSTCNKRFSTRSHLTGHMRIHSAAQSPLSCSFCQLPFTNYCALKVHMQTHKEARPFSCKDCGHQFAKNIHLKRHVSTHTGIRPFVCTMCNKNFSRSDHLKRHIQSIHAGERRHVCTKCGKAFVRKYELSKHIAQAHPPFPGSAMPDASWEANSFY